DASDAVNRGYARQSRLYHAVVFFRVADGHHPRWIAGPLRQSQIRVVDVGAEDAEARDVAFVRLDQIAEAVDIVRSFGDLHIRSTNHVAAKQGEGDMIARAFREQLEGDAWHGVDRFAVHRHDDVARANAGGICRAAGHHVG